MTEEISHALITRDGKYLAVRGEKDWYWKLPGGGIENGETPEDALRRELKEEVGITEFLIIQKVHKFHLQFKGRDFIFHTYLVTTYQEPSPLDIEEKLEIEWQNFDRMKNPQDQAPSQQVIYNRLKELKIVGALAQ